MSVVELQLSFGEALKWPRDPLAFIHWWSEFEATRPQFDMPVDGWVAFDDPAYGKVQLRVIGSATRALLLTPQMEIAIHGVRPAAVDLPSCAVCQRVGTVRPASLGAIAGTWPNQHGGRERMVEVCDEHAVFLDGSLQPYTPEGLPRCSGGGGAATFVCGGPFCRWEREWSDAFRVRHPGDPEVSYCRDCHARLFPPCVGDAGHCRGIGRYSCEHVDENGVQACGNRICPKHAGTWQIFGPDKEGIYLCPQHRDALRGDPQAAVKRMVFATAVKKLRLRRDGNMQFVYLPSLRGFQHTLRRLSSNQQRRRVDVELALIRDWLGEIGRSTNSSTAMGQVAVELVRDAQRRWGRNLEQHEKNVHQAESMLEVVRGVLPQVFGKDHVGIGRSLVALDFRPAQGAMKEDGLIGTLICTSSDPRYLLLFDNRNHPGRNYLARIKQLTRIVLIVKDSQQ